MAEDVGMINQLMKLILLSTMVLVIGCKESVDSDKALIPKQSTKVLNVKSGLSKLSAKLKIPLVKINDDASNKLKQLYKDYEIDFVLNSWFEKPFLLDVETGSYVAKIATYDEDGYPDILNYKINFGDITDIEADDFILTFAQHGFFQIGEGPNGDPLVIDLKPENKAVGFLDHEFVWKKGKINIRKHFKSFSSLQGFVEHLINDKPVPSDFYDL